MQDEKMMAERFDDATQNLGKIGTALLSVPVPYKIQAHEIRLRIGRPVMLSLPGQDVFVAQSGLVSYTIRAGLLTAGRSEIDEAFRLLCNSSVYAHQNEIRNGFIILRGGHRAGICGTAVIDSGCITNIRDISSISLRIARQIRGSSGLVIKSIVHTEKVDGTLIFGPPGCGKTTVLRDLARAFSCGESSAGRMRVAVVDERGEIGATFLGQPQNELGPCCDVLDGYPKGEGILQAVRCLSPDIIFCDEIGSEEDARAIEASLNAGVSVIASAHAGSITELRARPQIARLIASGAFIKAIQLQGRGSPGCITAIYDLQNQSKNEYRIG